MTKKRTKMKLKKGSSSSSRSNRNMCLILSAWRSECRLYACINQLWLSVENSFFISHRHVYMWSHTFVVARYGICVMKMNWKRAKKIHASCPFYNKVLFSMNSCSFSRFSYLRVHCWIRITFNKKRWINCTGAKAEHMIRISPPLYIQDKERKGLFSQLMSIP